MMKRFVSTSAPSRMIVLNLVRHGETEMNKADIVQSRTPGDLTERGIQMAQNLGKYLKDEQFDRVFTSDLRRCQQTTLNILKHSNKSPPEPILKPILRERDYGDLEFKSNQTVRDLIKKHGIPNHAVPLPGGEPHAEVMKRCGAFFQEICELADTADKQENILAVSHGSWIMCFLDYLAANTDKFELEDYIHEHPEKRPLKNTGRTKIHIDKIAREENNNARKRRLKFAHVHCVKHLENM